MSKIKCNVTNCSHNSGEICHADRVNIGGINASNDSNTCCGSFLNRLLYSDLTNCSSESGTCDCLVCYSKTCAHNENCLCSLEDISVGGGSDTAIYTETCCNSFESK